MLKTPSCAGKGVAKVSTIPEDGDWPESIPIDAARTLDQLTGRFQAVKDGLPELVKNSKDQYTRLGIFDRPSRQIVVLGHSQRRWLAVLDFGGATAQSFDQWAEWSRMTAPPAVHSADIEAGNGNGGKSFMVRGASIRAFIESVADGLRTRMVFDNTIASRRYIPKHDVEDGVTVKDAPAVSAEYHLAKLLSEFGLQIAHLPESCQRALARRQAYTFVKLEGLRDWVGSRASRVMRDTPLRLRDHAQAARTLETCDVWSILDRRQSDSPLLPERPEPFPGFETLPHIPVPDALQDPVTRNRVTTGATNPNRHVLSLRTSDRNMVMSGRRAANVIWVRNERNVVGFWQLAEISPGAMSGHIWGEVIAPALDEEDLVGSDRQNLADTSRTRALHEWVAEHIRELDAKLDAAQTHSSRPEDEARASATLQAMRDAMRQFLDQDSGGGDIGGGAGPRREPPTPGPRGKRIDRIELEPGRDMISVATGTTVPLAFRCYEVNPGQEDRPVIASELELLVEPSNSAELVGREGLRVLQPGDITLKLRAPSTGVESNELLVESIEPTGLTIEPPPEPLKRAQRTKIRMVFDTEDGPREDFFISAQVDDESLARIGRTGMFSAGNEEGSVLLSVHYGAAPEEVVSQRIEIGPDLDQRQGVGSDIPQIMLCDQPLSGRTEQPESERTVRADRGNPTIIDDPRFPDIVWINHESEESLAARRRGKQTSSIATKTFAEFLALKCYEVLSRLKMRQNVGTERSMSLDEFNLELSMAQTSCAAFIPIAYELANKMARGGAT